MDLNRWKVFRSLDPAVSAQVKLVFTWGHAKAAFMVMMNDDVFCIGKHVEAILSGKKDAKFPTKIEALCGKGVKDFQCGNNFVLALTENGKVYEWVGDGNPHLESGWPEKARATQIAAGVAHCVALTSCGKVYCWGVNNSGQLGTGNFEDHLQPRRAVLTPGTETKQKIIEVVTGELSTFAIGDKGDVWAWGNKLEVGKCGSSTHRNTPMLILKGDKIVKILCSSRCTVAIGVTSNLYFWRHSVQGGQPIELKLSNSDPILDIGSSIHASFIAYSTAKSVWVMGQWFDKYYDRPKITSYASVDEVFASNADATMCRPVKLPFQPPVMTAVTTLQALFDDEPSSDVKFIVRNEVIYAHKAFLEKRSQYFARMFSSDWKETFTGTVQIESYSSDVFRNFLNYLYTGKLNHLDCSDMLELLKVADYYREEGLLRECEQLIKLDVAMENVCLVYSVAVEHNAQELKRYALDFARPLFSDVIHSEGFAALNKRLTTQLMRELVAKRRLVMSSSSSSESDEEEKQADTNESDLESGSNHAESDYDDSGEFS